MCRGTRSTLGTLVPAGVPGVPGPRGNGTALPVTLLVEDQLGATVVALRR